MSKLARQEKTQFGKNGHTVEHNTLIDDSPLPPSDELARLKELDQDIIPWIKGVVEKEQNARLKFNVDRILLAKREQSFALTHNLVTLSYAFFIMILGMVFSYFLIKVEQVILGSVFGGSTILMCVLGFLKYGKTDTPTKK